MASIEELTNSFKASMYERLTSTFGFALIISWCYFNWPALYYMGFQEITETMTTIDKLAYIEANYSDRCKNVFYPIISAIAVSVFYPVISYVPFWCQEYMDREKRKKKNNTQRINCYQ